MGDLYTTRADSEFRLVGVKGDPQDAGFQLIRRLEKLDPISADTIATSLNLTRVYSSPKADRQTYSGTFVSSAVQPEVDGQDAVSVTQILTKVRTSKQDSEATLIRTDGDPQRAGFKIARAFKYIHPISVDTLSTALDAIDTYGSPKADRQTYSGRFIQSSYEPQKAEDKTVTINQVLTKVKVATDSSDADLVRITGDPKIPGTTVDRAWYYVAPYAADTLYAALNAKKTYGSGIKVDKQLYSGTFVVAQIRNLPNEDRTVTIEQRLIKTATTTDSATATLLGTEGDPQWAGFKIFRGWKYIAPASADGLIATLNGVESYPNGIKADSQLYNDTYINSQVVSQSQDDGTVLIRQTVTKVKSAIDSADADLLAMEGDPNATGSLLTRAWHYIDPTDADSLYTTLNAKKTYGSGVKADKQLYSGTFVVATIVPKVEEDRSITISQTLRKTATTTDSATAHLLGVKGDPYRTGFQIRRGWRYIDPYYVDGLIATLDGATIYSSGVKADSQLYNDTYVNSEVTSEVQQDKSHLIVQTVTKVRSVTDSGSAFLANIKGDPQRAGFQITRGWRYVNPTAADGLMTSLAAVTSYANGVKADAQLYADTFISSTVTSQREDDHTETIYQTVTKVKSAIDSADADLIKIEGDPKERGAVVIRAWHYIDPTDADTIFATLNNIKSYASGIKADNQLYSGKFICSRVVPETQEDRTVRITQWNTRVVAVTSADTLVNPLVDREKEIIHPFGEGTGTGYGIIFRYLNLDPTTDTKCIAIADTKLEAKMDAAKTYDLIDRKTQTSDDRTMTFYLLAQKKLRTAWSTTKYATPDRVMYENRGRGHEVRRHLWYGINRLHHDSVVGDLIDANSDTGFRTTSLTWRDDDIGGKDYEWIQVKSTSDTRTDSAINNTHGKEHLAVQNKHYDYSDYSSSTLPSDPALTTAHKFVSKEIRMNNRGLFDKVVVQQKRVVSNEVTAGVPARGVKQQFDRPKGYSAVDSAGNSHTLLYDRIRSTAADTVIRTVGISDTNFVTENIGYTDHRDGSASVSRIRLRVNKSAKYFWQSEQVPVGNYPRTVSRVWPYVWDTKATALMDSSGDARTDSKYQGSMCYHLRVERTPHWNGTATVTQLLTVPSGGTGSGAGGTNTDSVYQIKWGVRQLAAGVFSPVKIWTYYKYFASDTTAHGFADRSTTHYMQTVAVKDGVVKAKGDGTFDAYKVRLVNLAP